jgi:hypothetical protein
VGLESVNTFSNNEDDKHHPYDMETIRINIIAITSIVASMHVFSQRSILVYIGYENRSSKMIGSCMLFVEPSSAACLLTTNGGRCIRRLPTANISIGES